MGERGSLIPSLCSVRAKSGSRLKKKKKREKRLLPRRSKGESYPMKRALAIPFIKQGWQVT
jgi:hypothetical protein